MSSSERSAHPLDAESLARLRELDPGGASGLMARVVKAYMNSLDRLLPELQAARGAAGNLETIRQVAHTLKSSSASLGGLQLSRHCAEVEALAREGARERIEPEIDAMLAEVSRVRLALATLGETQP
jgi:HPt (histidine-containing phosphotransfer) domain-containing protein